jgi:glycosyltransferase involved in cell wall biosynthesis
MRIGVVSHMFPIKQKPVFGNFIKDELDHLVKHVDIRLIAPVLTRFWFGGKNTSSFKTEYIVKRPFVFSFPRYFMQNLNPYSMAPILKRTSRGFFENCDIIHAHNAFPDGVASVKAFGNKFPIIVTVHGSDVNMYAMKPNFQPNIVDALNKVNCIICVSTSLKNKLHEIGITTKCEVIPNGVNTELFSPGDRTEACRLLGLAPEKPRIIFIGNFTKVKGVEYLIQSMPAVLKEYPDCELILLGAQPENNYIKKYNKLIESTGIMNATKIVHMVPHEKLPPWMRASDLLVLPSIREGFGLVVAEALACGCPVVATKSGGPESIVGEGLGVLVTPCDYEALGKGILRVLNRTEIHNSAVLVKSIRDRFSYDIISQKIISVYNTILETL